jgi:phosphatidylserine decarboxylase
VSGTLEYLVYQTGEYLMAWDDRATMDNEQAKFGVKHSSGQKILFRQITGFLARRVVYYLKEGDTLERGKRFGLMKFGSRMDVVLPRSANVLIKEGDKVVAGESIIAKLAIR